MKVKIVALVLMGVLFSGSVAYVWAQDFLLNMPTECFELGKLAKVEKFGENGFISSCVGINPFENIR